MASMPPNSKAHYFLCILAKGKRDAMSFFPDDYRILASLAPIDVLRTYKDKDGTIKVYIVNRLDAIKRIKEQYGFFTTAEATKELQAAHANIHSHPEP